MKIRCWLGLQLTKHLNHAILYLLGRFPSFLKVLSICLNIEGRGEETAGNDCEKNTVLNVCDRMILL